MKISNIAKRRVEILGIFLLAFIITVVSAVSFSLFSKETALAQVKEECVQTISVSAQEYASAYFPNDGTSEIIAKSVSDTVYNTLSTIEPSEDDLVYMNAAIGRSVTKNLSDMGISLTDEEEKLLTSGIQALVISSVYKAIADRGLVSTESLTTIKNGLENRLKACEVVLATQADEVSASLNTLENLITAVDVKVTTTDENLAALAEEMNVLLQQLANHDLSNTVKQAEIAYIKPYLTNLESMIQAADADAISQLRDVQTELANFTKVMNEQDAIASANLTTLTKSLENATADITKRLNSQASSIEEMDVELSELTTSFNTLLTEYKTSQENTDALLTVISTNLGEGSVDARIASLCDELAGVLEKEISATNTTLNEELTNITRQLNTHVSSLKEQADALSGRIDSSDSSLESLSGEITSTSQSLEEAKLNLAGQLTILSSSLTNDISVLTSLVDEKVDKADFETLESNVSNVSEATNRNRTDITSLQSSLASKADITSLAEVETNITNVKNILNSVETANTADITALKQRIADLETQVKSLKTQIEGSVTLTYTSQNGVPTFTISD